MILIWALVMHASSEGLFIYSICFIWMFSDIITWYQIVSKNLVGDKVTATCPTIAVYISTRYIVLCIV